MELVKVIFFAIGSFFGVQNSTIFAETTMVHIDVDKKIIHITHNNLFSMIRNETDSLKVSEELYRIGSIMDKNERYNWREEFNKFPAKTLDFTSDKTNKQLHGKIVLHYNSKEQLKNFSIDYVKDDDSYAMINIPVWNIKTDTGELKGNYWYFKDDIVFTMTLDNIPDQYKTNQKSLYEYWEKVKP